MIVRLIIPCIFISFAAAFDSKTFEEYDDWGEPLGGHDWQVIITRFVTILPFFPGSGKGGSR